MSIIIIQWIKTEYSSWFCLVLYLHLDQFFVLYLLAVVLYLVHIYKSQEPRVWLNSVCDFGWEKQLLISFITELTKLEMMEREQLIETA